MQHISVTYSPISRKWETMEDGTQTRRVAYRGIKADCLRHAIDLAQNLKQPLFVFDKDGERPRQILP